LRLNDQSYTVPYCKADKGDLEVKAGFRPRDPAYCLALWFMPRRRPAGVETLWLEGGRRRGVMIGD